MRKRLIILSAVLFGSINMALAQITFQKTFGGINDDGGNSVQQTSDGGYIISGFTRSFGTDSTDVYLIKTDMYGNTLWTKTFGGSDHDYGATVQQTADGGYIITGSTTSFGAGGEDIYLIKTDANGNSLWSKTFGGINFDIAYWGQQTTDGGYIIAGTTDNFGAGLWDIYLIKTDANGDSLWTKTFGGTNYDDLYSVQQTADGGYIIAGITPDISTFYDDVYLIKTDVNGDTVWTKTFGGTDEDLPCAVYQTADGGYIISGITTGFGVSNSDFYLLKTDTIGNILWSKTYGGSGDEYGWSVQQTADGGYIIGGPTDSFGAGNRDVYLIKVDNNGDTLWTKTFGGTNDDGGWSVRQTSDGGYIIAGNTKSFGPGDRDVYLIKTDANGNSGCNEGGTATIVTSPATQVSIPATIVGSATTIVTAPATVVGSGGIVTTLCISVGINEITTANSFIISPNPSSGNFTISFEGTIMKGTVEISNILGENVYAENIVNESRKEINLKNASAGIYFVKVFVYPDSTGNGEKYYCRKIIVERD